ncbi:hypothetical protein B0H13DRAFT_2300877 [Mycena leptocephala]|nr:hypothetical protein B0H13DRAFT_2300877 [Mycena leptocephala]
MHTNLSVASGIPYDLVLGRDWIFFCRQSLPHASFTLSSGVAHPAQLHSSPPSVPTMDVDPSPVDGELNMSSHFIGVVAMSLSFAAAHLRPDLLPP